MKHEIHQCKDLEDIGRSSASYVYKLYENAVQKRSVFTFVLSGGKTPEVLYKKLAGPDFKGKIQWNKIKLFWGDERFVPINNPESNYGMAQKALLAEVPLPSENIFPIPTDVDSPDKSAELYEKTLRRFFQEQGSINGAPPMPVFDLILLGLGEDGHTASLFPDKKTNVNETRWVMSVNAPPSYPTRERVTLTLPVINSARNVAFLVSGANKRNVLQKIIEEDSIRAGMLPAKMVNPKTNIVWFTDICIQEF